MTARVATIAGQFDLVAALLDRLRPRGKSLIVTAFGDSIAPHGGGTWLGGLIRILGPLGLGDRIIRTSVFRLAQDDLLAATQSGRRSFYALTETGARQFHAASPRIYAVRDGTWDETWTQVWLSDHVSQEDRAALQRELRWLGFNPLGRNLMIHPGAERDAVEQAVGGLNLKQSTSILTARDDAKSDALETARILVAQTWPLADIAADHQAFIATFEPVRDALYDGGVGDPAFCFALRTLLVHDYRRVVLRDPMLPADLLDPDWPGLRAAALARDIYQRIAWPAQHHVMASLEKFDGPFGQPTADFSIRFGGLPAAA